MEGPQQVRVSCFIAIAIAIALVGCVGRPSPSPMAPAAGVAGVRSNLEGVGLSLSGAAALAARIETNALALKNEEVAR